jgi:hypothetical protein
VTNRVTTIFIASDPVKMRVYGYSFDCQYG